jgi:hypothetical protein
MIHCAKGQKVTVTWFYRFNILYFTRTIVS